MNGALILTGAPGSGKSSVLDALTALLEVDEVTFGAIETEQLARGWPWLTPEQWLPQLSSAVDFHRQAGRRTVLVVTTTETAAELDAVKAAVGAERTLVVCLTAPADLVARRVAEREPDLWPGKAELIEHAWKLADQIPAIRDIDVTLPTVGRRAEEVALEVRRLLVARGMAGPSPVLRHGA